MNSSLTTTELSHPPTATSQPPDARATQLFTLCNDFAAAGAMTQCLLTVSKDAESRALLIRKPRGQLREMMRTQTHWPTGSLGEAYHEYLTKNGYDPALFPEADFFHNLESESDYVNYRTWYYHDMLHLVCGFPTTRAGELGLLIFIIIQYAHPAIARIALSDLTYLHFRKDSEPDGYEQAQRSIRIACNLAKQARPLFAVPWEAWLSRDLDSIRHELNITPAEI